jgi:hypothetical protein
VEDGREVIVREDHVGGFLGDVGAVHAHGNANIGLFEGWRVIDPISRHGDNIAAGLERPDDLQLVVWIRSRKDGCVVQCSGEVLFRHLVDFVASEDRLDSDLIRCVRRRSSNRHAQLLANGKGGGLGIASDHDDLYAAAHQPPD